MKRKGTLTILAAAALALTGVIGVSSASASYTVLCSEQKSYCPSTAIQPIGSTIKTVRYNAPAFTIRNTSFNDRNQFVCNTNELTLKSTAYKGDPLPAEFQGSADPASCSPRPGVTATCTDVTVKSSGATIQETSGGNGFAKISGLNVSVSCSWVTFGISIPSKCVYAAPGVSEMELLPGHGSASMFTQLKYVSGSETLCGSESDSYELVVQNHINPTTTNFIAESL